uniref:C2H2-type domain-containing protein n=2 Tax=Gouania willdenowi TaxID=441366 RepID=A0A8C5H0R6_GOUWI
MEQFKAPSPLSLTANPADNWCSWEQSFRRYIAASGEKDEQGKIDILLHTIGEDALEVFNTLTVRGEKDEQGKIDILLHTIGEDALEVFNTLTVRGEGDELTMEDVLQAFKDHCSPQRNVVFERNQYWSHQRTAGTSVNTFTPLRTIKTEHGVQDVPVDVGMKMILPDNSLHHNTSRLFCSQSVPNTDETETFKMAAFMPKVDLHRLQLQQPSVTDCVFSERKNVEQLLPERLHIKEEPEMFSEGQEEKQLCVQQETNSAACPVKCEDEEEKPQASQLHWRQLTEMNMKEEPSTYSLNELMTRQSVGINSQGPEAAQNPDPSSLVLQGPDGTETDSSQTEGSSDDDDEQCWQKPLSETEAQISSTSLSSASKQRVDTGEKPFECYFCRKCFTRKAYLQSHMKVHTGENLFKCEVCSKCFYEKVNLKKHMKTHTGEKPFKCDVCSKCFLQKSDLRLHMRTHTGEKPFECDVCSKFFTRKSALQSHMVIHTGEKPFKCDICRKRFTRKQHLQFHMNSHTGEKPFECDVCKKCFTRKASLQLHMISHTDEKPFKCDVCRNSFHQKDDLKSHMRIHTGEKVFECDVCGKCLTRKASLQLHMRIHTGEKPFKCDVCSKCFMQKSGLTDHMRIHTGEKPFKCDICSKCFTRQHHLQTHMRMHKGEKTFQM